jgi:hypothetical protein
MIESAIKITGQSYTSPFRLYETDQSVDVDAVFEVLNGNLAAYRIRHFLSSEACQKIVDNFSRSEQKVPRLGYGADGVEGYFLGASHIEKTTQEYLKEVLSFEKAIQDLYIGTQNPIADFRNKLLRKKGLVLHPATCEGVAAGDSKAVYWNSLGDFLLQPHDDLAQLSDPRQKGFEIQEVKRVMAVNFYATAQLGAGQLKVWNIEPDDASRAALNLTYSGFPYPPELLEDFESLVIPVSTGDLCVINGNLIHGVLRGDKTASPKERLLVTCFTGFNNQQELIWWT